MSYNIITGGRRNGTSLLMLCLRTAGIPVLGFKYTYTITDEKGEVKILCKPNEKLRKGNPNGYWEMGLITTQTGVKDEHKYIGMPGDFLKLTTECYYKSEPKMIDKTIMILRHPRNVITSTIKAGIFKDEELMLAFEKLYRDIDRTLIFIKEHNIPYKIIFYEDLLREPHKVMKGVCEFVGRGNFIKGAEVVNQDLNRSKPFQGDYEALTKLEEQYNNLKNKR